MKIYNQGKIDYSKRTIYLDIDDVVIFSHATIITLLNKKFGTNKTIENANDWSYKSIYRGCTQELINEMFESDEFWDLVEPNNHLIKRLEKSENDPNGVFNSYNWIMVTKRTEPNLDKKYDYIFNSGKIPFFARHKGDIGFYGVTLNEKKSDIKMFARIQIDDYYPNLKDSDASLKIMLKNKIDTHYNDITLHNDNLQNLYVVNTSEELMEVLTFFNSMAQAGEDFIESLDEFELEEYY